MQTYVTSPLSFFNGEEYSVFLRQTFAGYDRGKRRLLPIGKLGFPEV
jgi:hypothetical protein